MVRPIMFVGETETPSPLCLLVVDDDIDDRLLLRRVAIESGWKVVEAASIAEAEAVLSETPQTGIDCILLDYVLPDGDGHLALEKLTARAWQVPVIMLTSMENTEVAVRLLEQGAADFVSKRALTGNRLREVVLRATRALRAERLKKIAENRLASHEALLLTVLEQMPAGVLITDGIGRVLFRNARFLALTGQDLSGAGSIAEMTAICDAPGQVGPKGRSLMMSGLAHPDPLNTEFKLRSPQGDCVVRMQRAEVQLGIADDDASVARVDVLGDVTDLVAAENYQQQIMAIATHDLRNPLSAITTNAGVLARPGEMPEEKRQKRAAGILASAKRMTRMIEDLFDYTNATLGRGIPVVFQSANLGTICNEAAAETRAAFPDREINLERTGDLTGNWDADRLHQVLQNLVGNAFKYGDPTRPVLLTVTADTVPQIGNELVEGVTLEVFNHGTPIDESLLPHIFDAYRRGAVHSQRSLGLGLYIARRILDAHQGTITVTSSLTDGTRFRVHLPKKPAVPSETRNGTRWHDV